VNFFSEEMRRNPFPAYDQVRAASPAQHIPQLNLWMIFDFEGVKRVMTDHDAFSSSMMKANRPNPPWLVFFDPPRHTKLRALIMRAFSPRIVANLEPRIDSLSRQLLDPLWERGEMDLMDDFAIPLPMMVIAELIGLPPFDWRRFRRWSDVIVTNGSLAVQGGEKYAASHKESAAVAEEMRAFVADCIAERKRAAVAGDDLFTALTLAEVEGEQLTENDIFGFLQLLLIAGAETTTNLIGNAMLSLSEYPEQLARLRQAPELLPSAIEETLRFRSPAQWMLRVSAQAVEIHGQTIPPGQLVLPMIGSANRDPKAFPDPHRFDIGRQPNQHIAFGHGIHFCIGAPLARLEGRVALTNLLAGMKSFELAGEGPWAPHTALQVHGPATLPIRFEAAERARASDASRECRQAA
jgi:cytochrome P450